MTEYWILEKRPFHRKHLIEVHDYEDSALKRVEFLLDNAKDKRIRYFIGKTNNGKVYEYLVEVALKDKN